MENILHYFIPILVNLLRYFVFAGIPFLIFYLLIPKKFILNKIQTRFAQRKDFLREISSSVQTSFIAGGIILLFLHSPLREYTRIYKDIEDYSVWWIPLSIIAALIIQDTYFYWLHRIMHHPKLFNKIHLEHHKSTNPSPWTSYSFHALEAIAEVMILPVILFCLPIHPIALSLFGVFGFMINVYGHLGYEIAPKKFRNSFLFEILNSSVHHNLHHEKFKGNYGLYFRIWDRIMKTEHPDYVKRYDLIQEKRFGTPLQSSVNSFNAISIVILTLFTLSSFITINAVPQIEGQWLCEGENGKGIVKIYKSEKGKYYGEFVKALDPVKQKMLIEKKIQMPLILKDFVYKGSNKWTEGKLFLPSKKVTVDGKLELVSVDKLKVTGTGYGMTKSTYWERVKN